MKTVRGATSSKNKQPLKNRAMELTENDKIRLEEKIRRLEKISDKPCQWFRLRLEYVYAWATGFVCGLLVGIKTKN